MSQNCAVIIRGGTAKQRIDFANEIAEKNGVFPTSPDYLLIQPENSIGIEDIRLLISKASLKPYQSPKKVIIIEDSEKMTTEAQNAFLKTLEEPSESTIILLLAANSDLLLQTILSRCQIKTLINNNDQPPKDTGIEKELVDIKNCSLGQRFKKAQIIATNKETSLKWVESLIRSVKPLIDKSLKSSADTDFTLQELAQIAANAQKAHNLISANTNPRLVIENFLLTIK